MTCIAVIKSHKGKLIFAGDRRVSSGDSYQIKVASKISKRNGIIMAGAGSAYVSTLIRNILQFPVPKKKCNVSDYMHNAFFDKLNELLRKKGFLRGSELHLPEELSTSILIGIRGQLFKIDLTNVSSVGFVLINEVNTPYAIGCGGRLALGSLLTWEVEGIIREPEAKLRTALKVASQVSAGCDDNIDIVYED
jgi:ATP-dependent protease HslVU (ClpYQ) peptidase subunit